MLKIILLAFLSSIYAEKLISPLEEASEVYNSLPEEERQYFLKFHIVRKLELDAENARGADAGTRPVQYADLVDVPAELHDKFADMDLPAEVSDVLYEWVKNENALNDGEMLEIAANAMVCRPPPETCASLNNPGTNCCM